MWTRLEWTETLELIGVRPEQFWGTLPASPPCIFVATPVESRAGGNPNRWTWFLTQRAIETRVERLFGVHVTEDVEEVHPEPEKWPVVRVRRPVISVYSRYELGPRVPLPPSAASVLDADGDGIADYVTLDVGPVVQEFLLALLGEALSEDPPTGLRVIVDHPADRYNPVPVVGEWEYSPDLSVTVPAPVLIGPPATVGQRSPLDPARHMASLAAVPIWHRPSDVPFHSESGTVRLRDCQTFIRFGLRLPEIGRAVAAEYPSELCPDCIGESLRPFRTDLMQERISILPPVTALGTRRGMVEFVSALRARLAW